MEARRSAHRPADQAHPALGQTRHPPVSAQGSETAFRMAVWGDIPRWWNGRWHHHAQMQQRGV